MNSQNFIQKVEIRSKVKSKIVFIALLFLLPTTILTAQVDIKSKIDPQIYIAYSKAIDLIEPLVNNNDTITLFIPTNYSFSRLSQESLKSLLVDKTIKDINIFFNNHSTDGLFDLQYFEKQISSNLSLNKINLRSSNSIFYQRNDDKYLFGDSPNPNSVKFETHVIKSVYMNGKIILNFLDGIFLF